MFITMQLFYIYTRVYVSPPQLFLPPAELTNMLGICNRHTPVKAGIGGYKLRHHCECGSHRNNVHIIPYILSTYRDVVSRCRCRSVIGSFLSVNTDNVAATSAAASASTSAERSLITIAVCCGFCSRFRVEFATAPKPEQQPNQ